MDGALRSAAHSAGGYRSKTHDIPVEHFEYAYIQKCNNVKELEKILLALRSGEEGVYPHLEEQVEAKLTALQPESRVLRQDRPIGTLRDLSKEEQVELKDDLSDWLQQMKSTDTKLKNETGGLGTESLPPPRATNLKTSEAKASSQSGKSNKRVKPRDYKEWDKVDIDAELEKVDQVAEENKTSSVRNSKSDKLMETLDSSSLTQAEKELKAGREKDKGNEAYRAGDYKEAVTYYSRSLSLSVSAASYNNRAIAYVKLSKWNKVIEDCERVLELEPENIKAYFRRALANKGRRAFQAAKYDLSRVLSVEPQNKKAQELLSQVDAELDKVKDKPQGRRMVIEEVGTSDSEEEVEEEEEEEEIEGKMNEKGDSLRKGSDESKGSNLVNGFGNHDNETTDDDKKSKGEIGSTSDSLIGGSSVNIAESSAGDSPKPDTKNQTNINVSPDQEADVTLVKEKQEEKPKQTTQDTSPKGGDSEVPPQEAPKPRVVHLPPLPAKVAKLKEEGNVLFKGGQYGEAIEKYNKAVDILKSMPDHYGNLSTIYSNRAACKTKIGDCSGCIKDCDLALELVPHSIKPILRRAAAYEISERFRHAYVDYKYALGMDGSIHSAHQGADRCRHMLQREDGVRWREKLPSIPSVPTEEIPIFNNSSTTGPTPGVASVASVPASGATSSSSVLTSSGEREAAKDSVRKTETKSAEEQFQELKSQGSEGVQKGNFKHAVESYTQCIHLFPDRAVSYTNRALCYLRLNQPSKADEDCTKALELEENNVKALFRRAQARKMLKQYKDSIADLTKLLKTDPKNSAAKKELEVVKNYWREELNSLKSPSTTSSESKVTKKSKEGKDGKKQTDSKQQEQKQRKRLLIQEVESSSEEEEEKPAPKEDTKKASPRTKDNGKTTTTTTTTATKDKKENINVTSKQASGNNTIKTAEDNTKLSGDVKQETSSETNNSKVTTATSTTTTTTSTTNSAAKPASKKCTKSAPVHTSTGLPCTPPSTPKLTKVTPYEFMSAWNSLKTSTGIMPYAELLDQIQPKDLPKVLSNKLESSMLDIIVKCIHQHFAETDPNKAYGFLEHICKVPRFEMLTMFLSSEEKRGLKEVFSKLHKHTCVGYSDQQIQQLQKKFGI